MTNNEVNKVISKYMGYTFRSTDSGELYIEDKLTARFKAYTESLDSLVPVWELLVYVPDLKRRKGRKGWVCSGKQSQLTDVFGKADTIQEAAAHATAKAILAIGKKK